MKVSAAVMPNPKLWLEGSEINYFQIR